MKIILSVIAVVLAASLATACASTPSKLDPTSLQDNAITHGN